METQEQQYIKGFNHGYVLAIHEPDLAKQITSSKNDHNDYFKGLVSGKQEHDMEKIRERLHGKSPSQNEPPAKDVPKDKGREK